MKKPQYVFFGDRTWKTADGPCMSVWACMDLKDRPPVDEAFDQVAEEFLRVDADDAPRYDNRVWHSILILGYERREARLQKMHEAYNRMWARYPTLWERIQLRGFPMTLWMINEANAPFFGIIQPALHLAFEVWAAPDCRETEHYSAYENSGDYRWRTAILPIAREELEGARAFVRSQQSTEPNG